MAEKTPTLSPPSIVRYIPFGLAGIVLVVVGWLEIRARGYTPQQTGFFAGTVVGFALIPTAIVWAIYRFGFEKPKALGNGVFSFLGMFGICVVAQVAAGLTNVSDAHRLAGVLRTQVDSVADLSRTEPIAPPASEPNDRAGRLGTFSRNFMNALIAERTRCNRELAATGLSLDHLRPEYLAQERNLDRLNEGAESVPTILAECKRRASAFPPAWRHSLAETFGGPDNPEAMSALASFDASLTKSMPLEERGFRDTSVMYEQIAKQLSLLRDSRGNWIVDTGVIRFRNPDDLRKLNEFAARAQTAATDLAQIRDTAKQSLLDSTDALAR